MTFTVREVAERYGVSAPTVLAWIARHEMKAIDVSRKQGGRPTWRITERALADFEEKRTPGPPPLRTRRRKQLAAETFY